MIPAILDYNRGFNLAQSGNALNVGTITNPAITALDENTIALIDDTNDELTTYAFDGTDWAQVGNALAISGGIFGPTLTTLNSTDIAAFFATPGQLRVYRWDGSDWAQVGSSFARTGALSAGLTAMSSSEVCFITATEQILRNYGWNGSNFTTGSNTLGIGGLQYSSLSAVTSSLVLFLDDGLDSIRLYSKNASTWSLNDTLPVTAFASPASIAWLSNNAIVATYGDNDSIVLYEIVGGAVDPIGISTTVSGLNRPRVARLSNTSFAMVDQGTTRIRKFTI